MTLVSLRKAGSERYILRLDDGREITTTLGVVTELRLFAGKSLEEAQLELIRQKTEAELARVRALSLLSQRPHSRRELREKLERKGVASSAAETAVEWLDDHGYLNDSDYASAVSRHYARKGYGSGRIRAELSRRGVPREFWDDALKELPASGGQIEAFLRARMKNPEDRDELRRLSAALLRRGYRWEEIREAMERLSQGDWRMDAE